jgi:Helicase conserved C-terminal domain
MSAATRPSWRAVSSYASKGQVLLFANSVWHTSHLAALLQLRGTQAASVHAGTETSARQYFIRQFQGGKLKVLCNYGVLTSGFDAPKTDVIVISRPVFSPVRYMQMVGRGLRGEKNGGTTICRVVTVLDNIVEYSDRLAYHTYFTPYFQLPDSVWEIVLRVTPVAYHDKRDDDLRPTGPMSGNMEGQSSRGRPGLAELRT